MVLLSATTMKFTVNINQKAVFDLGLQGRVDVIDLAIYDFVTEFMLCEDCHKINIGNEQYYWVKADLIIENLPLLGITTTRGINKRIEKLIECNLLERCPDNQTLRQSFFKVGKLYKEYKFPTWNENSKGAWNENSKPIVNIEKENVYIDNNNKLDYKEESEDKSSPKKDELDMSIVAPDMREVVDTWLTYKKEKGQSYKPTGFNTFYKKLCKLSGNNPQTAMEIIEASMSSNYAGIFPISNNHQAQTNGREERAKDAADLVSRLLAENNA